MNKMINSDDKCEQCNPESIQKIKNLPIDTQLLWLYCEHCNKWIHAICDEFSAEEAKMTRLFYCKKCRDDGHTIVKYDTKINEKSSEITTTPSPDKSVTEIDCNDEDEIIPNSQPNSITKAKSLQMSKPSENIFSTKRENSKEKLSKNCQNEASKENSDKVKALESRTKAHILKEYKKLEMKVKERDEKYKEKVEKIEKLNNEITNMKEQQQLSIETINKLTAMTNEDDQNKIRTAIEAQRNAEIKVSVIEEENHKLKKINIDKQET